MYSDDYSLQRDLERQAEIDAANGLRPLPAEHPTEPLEYPHSDPEADTMLGAGIIVGVLVVIAVLLWLGGGGVH